LNLNSKLAMKFKGNEDIPEPEAAEGAGAQQQAAGGELLSF
jgi:hypothetical protein